MIRSGFALVVSLLVAITLSLLGLGALAVGLREAAIGGAVERRERARLQVETDALAAVDRWSTRAHADLRLGESRTAADPDGRVTVSRIDSSLFVVHAEWEDAAGPGPGVVARAGLLVRTYPLHRLSGYLPAALTVETSATLAGGAVVVPDSCADTPAVLGPADLLAGASIAGSVLTQNPDDAPDPLPADLLAAIATVRMGPGRVTPRPRSAGGECRSDPTNWGAGPGHPCHDLLPLIHAVGPLTVDGGLGRGILVVDGDLVLDGGFRLQGIVIVRGELIIRGGATVEGAVRAASLRLEDGRVVRKPCDPGQVLASPALDRAFRPPGRWWIPVF